MKKRRPPTRRPVKTKCCGTVRLCKGARCRLGISYAGASKCIVCGWVWEMPEGREGYPISSGEMARAHS